MSTVKPHFFTLCLLVSLGLFSTYFVTPALPEMVQYFQVSKNAMMLAISATIISSTIGQLFISPLSRRHGYKIALYCGILLYVCSSIFAIIAAILYKFDLLVIARVLMGIGTGAIYTLSIAITSTNKTIKDAAKSISYLMISFAIAPRIATAVGGVITTYINWQACFYFLALYGLVLLYLSYRIHETDIVTDIHALNPSKIFHSYLLEIKNMRLMICACLAGSVVALYLIFGNLAPFVAIDLMGLNASQYGLLNLMLPIGTLTGVFLLSKLINRLTTFEAILLGIFIYLIGVILMLVTFIELALSPIWLFLPMLIILMGGPFVLSNASSLSIQSGHDPASASAINSFISGCFTSVSILALGVTPAQSKLLLPLSLSVVVLIQIILAIYLWIDLKKGAPLQN